MKRMVIFFTLAIFLVVGVLNCEKKRWSTTSSTKKANDIDLDVEAVEKAFKSSSGTGDFEKQVNEIYTGPEVLSVAVEDKGADKQIVAVFIDENENASMEESERLLSFTRTGLDERGRRMQYSMTGYGPYGYYSHRPMWHTFGAGMATYWLMSRAFRPYYTPVTRITTLRSSRNSYRRTSAYKKQVSKTRTAQSKWRKNATTSQKSAGKKWNKKRMQSSSWKKGTRSARTKSAVGSRSRSSSSSSRSFGSSRSSRSSGGFRSGK